MGSFVRCCALVVALAVGPLGGTARAGAIGNTIIIGGPGGANFSEGCAYGGWYLVGIEWSGYKDINEISPICQKFEDGYSVGDPVNKARYGEKQTGATIGVGGRLLCPPDTAVETIGVGVSKVNLVHKFSFACRNPKAHVYTNTAWAAPGYGQTNFVQPAGCGGGAIAVGVIGRSGALIDALGLMCEVIAAPPVEKPIHSHHGRPSAAPRAPAPAPPPQATATDDVDMYSEPNGDSTNLGVWTKGSHATPLGKQDGWCKLKGISNGQDAWVWGEFVSGCG